MKKKILIADDDKELVEVFKERLGSAGYDVIGSFDGVETYETARREKPDLIILDWKMPMGKGSAVLDMLTEKEDTRAIPVIIYTGVDEPGMYEIAMQMGVKHFIRKPMKMEKIIGLIEKTLK